MVIGYYIFDVGSSLLFAAAKDGEAVFEQLDAPRRAAVVMALLGLTLVGLFLIAFVMLGGHWVRRLARHRLGARQFEELAKEDSSLRESLKGVLPDKKSNDTVMLDTTSKDTKVET